MSRVPPESSQQAVPARAPRATAARWGAGLVVGLALSGAAWLVWRLTGFEYGLDMDTETRDDDFTFVSEGVDVVIDPFSAQYLTGLSIGYHSSFQGTGFTFENPNATGSCGCGTSFAV